MISICVLTAALLLSSSHAISISLKCPSTHPDNIAGICHSKCPSGYEGMGPACLKNCPRGWKGVGGQCHKWDSKIRCTSSGCGAWGWFPCCKGGWRITNRATKVRDLKEMMVSFRFSKEIEDLGKACVGAASSVVNDIKSKAKEMLYTKGSKSKIRAMSTYSNSWGKGKMDRQKDQLNNCGRKLKDISSDWIKDAVGTAVALYDTIKSVGRRRIELHEAGQSAAHVGEPVVLHESGSQVVRDLPDGSLDVEMDKSEFEGKVASYVTEVIEMNFAEEAEKMSDEEKSELEDTMRKSLMDVLFEEDSFLNANADLTIADLTASDADASPLEKILNDAEEDNFVDVDSEESLGFVDSEEAESNDRRRLGSTDAATDNEADGRRRRLGGSSIDTCSSPAFLISVGAAVDVSLATGSASLDEGYSSCGLGLYYTLAAGYSSEPLGAEGFVSFNMFGKGSNIHGDARWFQIGMDLGTPAEVAGFELQISWSPSGGVLGMGWTFSAGVGVNPICVSGGWAHTKLLSKTR